MRTKVKGPKHVEGARRVSNMVTDTYLKLVLDKPFRSKPRAPRL